MIFINNFKFNDFQVIIINGLFFHYSLLYSQRMDRELNHIFVDWLNFYWFREKYGLKKEYILSLLFLMYFMEKNQFICYVQKDWLMKGKQRWGENTKLSGIWIRAIFTAFNQPDLLSTPTLPPHPQVPIHISQIQILSLLRFPVGLCSLNREHLPNRKPQNLLDVLKILR